MSTPMTAQQFVDALKKEGLTVSEKYSGWRTHGRDSATGKTFGPVNGVVIHHTAGRDSLSLVYNGTSALPGPLCHTHLAKSGTATMISAHRANHAGGFAQNAHDAVVAESSVHPRPSTSEPVDGNDHYYGIEIENLGDGKDFYPQDQYDAAVNWAAAICRFHGWTANSVIGHKEGTTRKIDPKGPIGKAGGEMWDMDEFRKDVQAQINKGASKPATPSPAPAKPAAKVVDLSNVVAAAKRDPGLPQGGTTHAADVKLVEAALRAEGLLSATYATDGSYGTTTKTAYKKWQQKLGYIGRDADGIPGLTSLKKLGAKHGFTVKG